MTSDISNTSHGIFVVKSTIYKNPNAPPLKAATEEHAENLNNAIKQLVDLPTDLVIIAKDGTVMSNRTLLAMYSPTLKAALSNMNYCGDSSTIILPDCSMESIQAVLELIKSGFSSCVYLSFRDYTHILDVAKLLEIDLNFQNVQGTQIEKITFQNERVSLLNERNDSAVSSQEGVKDRASNTVDKKLKSEKSSQNLDGNVGKPVASPKSCDIQNTKKRKIILRDQGSLTEFFQNPKISKEQKHKALTEELGFNKELKNIARSKMCTSSEKRSPKELNTSKNCCVKNISNIDQSSCKTSCALKKRKSQILTKENRNIENENRQHAGSRRKNDITSKNCKKSAYQLIYLRKEFNNSPTISIERAQLLSKELLLTEKQIRDWFKRQRSKLTNLQQGAQSKIKIKSKMIKSMDKIQQDNGKIINKLKEQKGKLFDKIQEELQDKLESDTELGESNSSGKSQRQLYNCLVCPKSFLNISNLRFHSSVHSNLKGNGDNDFKQAKVSKVDDSETNETNREESNESRKVSGSYLGQYKCNDCDSSFESKLLLKFHKNEDCIAKLIEDRISIMKQKLKTSLMKS